MTIRNMKTNSSTPGNPSSLFRPRVGAVSARAAMAGVLAVLAAAPSARAGVTVPTLWTENGHSYQVVVVPDGIAWSDARDAAVASGGHLVTLTSEAENGFVHGLIAGEATAWVSIGTAPNQTTSGPWIGLFQAPGSAEPAGGWGWVTGEPLGFANWEINRPNDVGGIENFGQYFGVGVGNRAATWNDLNNRASDLVSLVAVNPRGYIVEFPAVPEPSTVASLLVAVTLTLRRRRPPGEAGTSRKSPTPSS